MKKIKSVFIRWRFIWSTLSPILIGIEVSLYKFKFNATQLERGGGGIWDGEAQEEQTCVVPFSVTGT